MSSAVVGESSSYDELAYQPFQKTVPPRKPRGRCVRSCSSSVRRRPISGVAIDQHAGHEERFGQGIRCRVQRAAHLEETSRRQGSGNGSQLRRHLRHELGRSGQDGLLVLDAWSGLQGILLDFWQRPISGPKTGGRSFLGDVGFFGPDGRQEWQVPAFATWVRGARA